MKFAAYIPELVMCQIEAIYIYNTNLSFRTYAYKLSTAVRIFSHIKVRVLVRIYITLVAQVYIRPGKFDS